MGSGSIEWLRDVLGTVATLEGPCVGDVPRVRVLVT